MSRKRPAEPIGINAGFTSLEASWLTWLGFFIAALGWALLLGGATIADSLIARAPRALPPTFHADLIEVAKCVIVSGFGLAIIGALQSGFGTLNRFFGAVLMRSAQRDTEPARPMETPTERPATAAAPTKRRPYRQFPDGSVEVDTIVGTRLFKSMAEAREFI